jgi:hypothetical protein
METNDDDHGLDVENPRWQSRWGSGGPFNSQYSHTNFSGDEGNKSYSYIEFATLDNNSWEIRYLQNQIPDLSGETDAYIDFAFSTYYGLIIPAGAGFVPGTMTVLPTGWTPNYDDFEPPLPSDHLLGMQYNSSYCTGVVNHFGGSGTAAFNGNIPVYRATRFAMPRLLQADADYVGIGIASWNVSQSIALELGIDSIAIVVY